MRKQDLSGKRYGKLIVTHQGPHGGIFIRWFCRCDCGNESLVFASALRSGITKSCGCLRGDASKESNQPNRPASKEYRAWAEMKKRCLNPKVKAFKYYGARGITVCDRWRESFSAFLQDVGRAPSDSMSIDRIDNDRNYEPGNVRWATLSQQNKNRRAWKRGPSQRLCGERPCLSIEIHGRQMTIAEIAGIAHVRPAAIYKRIARSWPTEALLWPALPKGARRPS